MTFGQRTFVAQPPDKGSFPLDHFNECKLQMIKYSICLRENDNDNSKCRVAAKDYLECRMDKNLMKKEDIADLGFADLKPKTCDPVKL